METSFPWEDGDPPDPQPSAQAEDGDADDVDDEGHSLVAAAGSSLRAGGAAIVAGRSARMGLQCRRSSGELGASASPQCCCASLARRFGGHSGGEGAAAREGDGDGGHGVAGVADAGSSQEQLQLDLGLSDITKYPSYSKLWRMLYFVNDAPFRIHNYVRGGGGGGEAAGGQCWSRNAAPSGVTMS